MKAFRPGCRAASLAVLACITSMSQTPPEQAACRISGVVHRGDTGQPVEKASVTLYPQDASALEGGSRRVVRTGPDGSFVFTALHPGTYAIEASRTGFVYRDTGAASHISLQQGDALSNVSLTLIPAGVISGVVVDRDHEPVEGLPVMPLRVRYEPGGKRELSGGNQVITDDQGRFRLYGLHPGLYYVRTGGRMQRPMMSVPLKKNPEGGAQYAETWYPEDALSEDGEPLRIGYGSDPGDIMITVSPESAVSIIGRVDKGPRARKTNSTEVVCTKVVPVTLMFGAGGTPVDADGSFRIDGLTPGDYILAAQTTENGGIEQTGYAQVHVSDRNLRITIEPGNGAEVSGRVGRSESDAPLPPGITVFLSAETSIAAYPSPVDSGGHFNVTNIPPGEYMFGVISPKSQSRRFYISEATCGGAEYAAQTLRLDTRAILSDCAITVSDDTGVVRGQVIDGEIPQPHMAVVLVPQTRELRRISRYALTTRSGEQGHFEMQGVIPGDYFLFALPGLDDTEAFSLSFPDRHKVAMVSVHVPPGETQTVNVSPVTAQ